MRATRAPLFQIIILNHASAETGDHAGGDANNEDVI